MYVVELAVEGLEGFPARARLDFRGHLDVIQLDSSEARSAILDVLFHTLFPDPDRSDATTDLADRDARRKRSVLTVAGRDRVPYRLLRDLTNGQCRLYRFDRDAGSHELLTESGREAHQFLRVQHQLPDDFSFERLFMFSPESRPSLGAKAKSRSGAPLMSGLPAPSGPGLGRPTGLLDTPSGLGAASLPPGAASQLPRGDLTAMFPLPSVLGEATGMNQLPSGFSMHNALVREELEISSTVDLVPDSTDDVLRGRYHQLLSERTRAQRRARVERNLDMLSEREEAALAAVEAVDTRAARIQEIDQQLRTAAAFAELPDDFLDRLESFETKEQRYHEELRRLEEERAGFEESRRRLPAKAWFQEPMVWGGFAALVASVASAIVLGIPELVLGQVFGGALAGWGGLRWVQVREAAADLEARLAGVDDRAGRIERLHRLDTATVRGLMKRLGEDDIHVVAEQMREVVRLKDERRRLREELAGDVEARGERARKILLKIATRKEEAERALTRYRDDGATVNSLDRRLEVLSNELRARGVDVGDLEASGSISVVVGRAEGSKDDDDEDDAYGDGYGPSASSGSDDDGSGGHLGAHGLWCASGSFLGRSSGVGGYGGGGASGGRALALVELAADLAGAELEGFLGSVAERLGRFVKALTSGRFGEVSLTPNGLRLGNLNYEELEGKDLDQIDAALRLALLESVLRVRRAPVLIEEPIAALPPDRRDVLKRIYNHLAQLTQVVIVTPADDLDGHRVTLSS